MNWEAIGALGEVIGGFAVVVTLLYLARQSKNNAAAINRAAVQATMRGRSEATRFLSRDPVLCALLWKGAADPDSLNEVEWQRFFLVCAAIVRPLELSFLDYEAGRMNEELWQGQKFTISYWFVQPGIQRWLDQYGQTLYPPFVAYLRKIIAEHESAAAPEPETDSEQA
ncbi:MAG: hypothetical protein HKN50_06560 [Gammaproteobacteria bacterium]|nr:hypothetical protein [Gammaproteobacteria bacterium]